MSLCSVHSLITISLYMLEMVKMFKAPPSPPPHHFENLTNTWTTLSPVPPHPVLYSPLLKHWWPLESQFPSIRTNHQCMWWFYNCLQDIPVPPFMTAKEQDDWSDEEKKLAQEYEKKVKDLEEEREKYRWFFLWEGNCTGGGDILGLVDILEIVPFRQ